jgi:hypothetical protein
MIGFFVFKKSRFGAINAENASNPFLPVTDPGFLVCNCLPSSINRPASLVLSSTTFKLSKLQQRKKP